MNKFLLQITLLFFAQILSATNDPFKIIIDLNDCKNNELKITILTPKIEFKKIKFTLPQNVPGCISEIESGKLISEFKATTLDNQVCGIKQISSNEFEIENPQKLNKIEYRVQDSWHSKNFKTFILPSLGTSFIANKHFLLNFAVMLGYIPGFENYTYKVEIQKPANLNGFSGIGINTFSGTDYVEVPNFITLIDNPIMYAQSKEYSFLVGKTRYNIGFYSENNKIKMSDISPIIKSVCEGADEFCGGLTNREYTFLFNFVEGGNNLVKSEDEYGAVTHSHSGVFVFQETNNLYKIQRDVQLTASHEIFHLFEPLNLKTDLTNKLNFKSKVSSSNIWVFEGFTEYFSLLMQLQKELITEAEFITEIRNKISLAQHYEPFSLKNASEQASLEGNESNYKNFYLKGAIMAMMLDLKISKLTKGVQNLQTVMNDLQGNMKKNYVLKDEELLNEIVKYSHPEIKSFFENYVIDTQSINYNEYLSTIGYKYVFQKTDTSKLYANVTYRYAKNNKEFYATNISMDQIGLRDGDVLLAINGKKITKENIDVLLDKIGDPSNKKRIVFQVRRAEKVIELTGQALVITKNQRNLIQIDKKMDPEVKAARKLFNGGRGRAKSFNLLN